MSLDRALFNVATSRAKQLTIIVADKSILNTSCHRDVRSYLIKITSGIIPEIIDEYSNKLKDSIIEGNGISLHLKGKIDLSKFETSKQNLLSQPPKRIYISSILMCLLIVQILFLRLMNIIKLSCLQKL